MGTDGVLYAADLETVVQPLLRRACIHIIAKKYTAVCAAPSRQQIFQLVLFYSWIHGAAPHAADNALHFLCESLGSLDTVLERLLLAGLQVRLLRPRPLCMHRIVTQATMHALRCE